MVGSWKMHSSTCLMVLVLGYLTTGNVKGYLNHWPSLYLFTFSPPTHQRRPQEEILTRLQIVIPLSTLQSIWRNTYSLSVSNAVVSI